MLLKQLFWAKNANGILSSDSSLVFGELDNNDSDDIVINVWHHRAATLGGSP